MKVIYFLAILLSIISFSASAQILDDLPSTEDSSKNESSESFDDIEEKEELFNEMFAEYPEEEKDVNKTISINEITDRIAEKINERETKEEKQPKSQLIALENDVYLSIVAGSYKVFQSLAGITKCSFSVKLRSEINRQINMIALSLKYPDRSFAFIFRDIPEKGEQIKNITTVGDICYNLGGIPDISINKCKIKSASGDDCAKHIKWDNESSEKDF